MSKESKEGIEEGNQRNVEAIKGRNRRKERRNRRKESKEGRRELKEAKNPNTWVGDVIAGWWESYGRGETHPNSSTLFAFASSY
jgi:hypothetical protein